MSDLVSGLSAVKLQTGSGNQDPFLHKPPMQLQANLLRFQCSLDKSTNSVFFPHFEFASEWEGLCAKVKMFLFPGKTQFVFYTAIYPLCRFSFNFFPFLLTKRRTCAQFQFLLYVSVSIELNEVFGPFTSNIILHAYSESSIQGQVRNCHNLQHMKKNIAIFSYASPEMYKSTIQHAYIFTGISQVKSMFKDNEITRIVSKQASNSIHRQLSVLSHVGRVEEIHAAFTVKLYNGRWCIS